MRDSTKAPDGQDVDLKHYEYRIIVTSVKGFEDAVLFDEQLCKYLRDLGLDTAELQRNVVWLVGDTQPKVLELIRDWCAKHNHVYKLFKAQWDNIDHENAVVREKNGREYNALAGYWLNEELTEVASHLITFYDGVSPNDQDLVQRMTENHHPCRAILVHIDKDKEHYHGQPRRR